MNLKSITAHSAVALSLVSVCSLSHASFFDNLFSSSTKEPVALSATTQEIMKNHPVWVIDGKDTSAWSVVEGKKPRRGAAPLLLKQDRGDLGLIPAQSDAGYVATKTEKISLFQSVSDRPGRGMGCASGESGLRYFRMRPAGRSATVIDRRIHREILSGNRIRKSAE